MKDVGDGVGDAELRPGGGVAEQVLDLGEHLLDRVTHQSVSKTTFLLYMTVVSAIAGE
jgi:hypothetical protein